MQANIRKNIFETNSSSMHTIVISENDEMSIEKEISKLREKNIKKKDDVSYLYLNPDEYDFGRDFEILDDLESKICYVIASSSISDISLVKKIIKEKIPEIQGLYFEFSSYEDSFKDLILLSERNFPENCRPYYNWGIMEAFGAVDHQSQDNVSKCLESMDDLDEFKGMTREEKLKELLFNPKFLIIIDSDECTYLEDYIRNGLIERDRFKYILRGKYDYKTEKFYHYFDSFEEYWNRVSNGIDEDEESCENEE